MLEPIGRGVLGAPVEPGHDSGEEEDATLHSRGTICPGDAPSLGPRREEGAGNAGCRCTRELARGECAEKSARDSTGTTGQSGIPCAMLDDLFRALPGVPGFVATVPPGLFDPEVDTSVGVPGPHGFIGRVTRASSGRTHASIATRLTFRDDRP